MFDSVLIANRGEIACRIIRTARRLGLRTIAVHSDGDARAQHVALADEAIRIGPSEAAESYLAIEKIVAAARRSGAAAVHPGYGFLAENADFAEACAGAGLVFIGPTPAAIRAMGSKSAAKRLMEQAGVPLVPGYHGAEQSPELLAAEAEAIGFPVLIKAAAGGGGKGMRVVERAGDFTEALALAQGEARAAFGDATVLIEKYLTRPRHIEIQVFADSHGNVVHLFERDCSLQRRHQKVIEEAPAPFMTVARRASMGEAACAAARAIEYVGAGTVEFIAEGDAFHFMEMNTRLQVEHPVTEAVTGQDLVEWQFRVAAGEALPLAQEAISLRGHAIEARLYAEDPARDYAPATGTLGHLRWPEAGPFLRIDTGVAEGDAISVFYDPMIAKVIAAGADREQAAARLADALDRIEIDGVVTNIALLRGVLRHDAFRAGEVDTGFLARHAGDLLAPPAPAGPAVLAAAVHAALAAERPIAEADSLDFHSPWALATAWRLNGDGYQDFELREGEAVHRLRAHPRVDGGFRLDLPDGAAEVSVRAAADGASLVSLDDATLRLRMRREGATIAVHGAGIDHRFTLVDPLAASGAADADLGRIAAPMPGRVVEIAVEAGERVAKGALLVTVEAMKVQFRITAPADGAVTGLRCAAGDLVEEGAELVDFAPDDSTPEATAPA